MNVPNETEDGGQKETVPADRGRLPFGWTPSPAYPGKLGVAGSVLIPASSNADAKLSTSCRVGWESELSSIWNAEQR